VTDTYSFLAIHAPKKPANAESTSDHERQILVDEMNSYKKKTSKHLEDRDHTVDAEQWKCMGCNYVSPNKSLLESHCHISTSPRCYSQGLCHIHQGRFGYASIKQRLEGDPTVSNINKLINEHTTLHQANHLLLQTRDPIPPSKFRKLPLYAENIGLAVGFVGYSVGLAVGLRVEYCEGLGVGCVGFVVGLEVGCDFVVGLGVG
jgi:hypothetical protein